MAKGRNTLTRCWSVDCSSSDSVKTLILGELNVLVWLLASAISVVGSCAMTIKSREEEKYTVEHVQPPKKPQPAKIPPIDEKLIIIGDWLRQFELHRAIFRIDNDFGAFVVHLSVPGYIYQKRLGSLVECVDWTIERIKEIEEIKKHESHDKR